MCQMWCKQLENQVIWALFRGFPFFFISQHFHLYLPHYSIHLSVYRVHVILSSLTVFKLEVLYFTVHLYMYQRLTYYQDFFFLNLSQNYRLLNIILFYDILQYTYMLYLPDSSYSFQGRPFLFYRIFCTYTKHVHIITIFTSFSFSWFIKCTSNKSLFGPNHSKSNCFAGTCFILFHDFLEYKICIQIVRSTISSFFLLSLFLSNQKVIFSS